MLIFFWQVFLFTFWHTFTPVVKFPPVFERNLPLSRPCWMLLASLYLLQGSSQAALFWRKKKISVQGKRWSCSENTPFRSNRPHFPDLSWSLGKVLIDFSAHHVRVSECVKMIWVGGKFEESCACKMERTAEAALRRLAALETSAILPCYSLRRLQQHTQQEGDASTKKLFPPTFKMYRDSNFVLLKPINTNGENKPTLFTALLITFRSRPPWKQTRAGALQHHRVLFVLVCTLEKKMYIV